MKLTAWTLFVLTVIGLFSADFTKSSDYAMALIFGGYVWFFGYFFFHKLFKS